MHLNECFTFTGRKAGEQPKSDGDLVTETVNGQAIYCRFVRRWRGVGAQP